MSNVLDEISEGFEPSPELLSIMIGSEPAVLLSLDVGTSGVRAALFDEHGSELAGQTIRIEATSSTLADSGAIDPDQLIDQVAYAIDTLFSSLYETNPRIELIALSCFWHSLMGVDANGTPTTLLFGWSDRRSARQAQQLRTDLDENRFHARTGCRFHPSYWPAKLLRLRNEEPEVFRLTNQWLSFADYLMLRLVGVTGTSVSMASGTGLMDQHTCEWDETLTDAIGVLRDQLPKIAPANHVGHKLGDAYARRWPQLAGAHVLPAVGDGAANNIGAGCTTRQNLALMIGTSGAMRMVYEGPPPAQVPAELWCYRVDRERVVIGGALSDGGSLYKWMRETLFPGEGGDSIEDDLELLEPDSHGLTVLPFWLGERSTGWHADAKGSIIGLSPQTRPIEILRAAMEAVAYRFALIAQAIDPFAAEASIIASGHALRSSPVWAQILADTLGRRINVSGRGEASTRGAALLALEAAGKIKSIEDFPVQVAAVFEPDMSCHARYRIGLSRQQSLYERVIVDN